MPGRGCTFDQIAETIDRFLSGRFRALRGPVFITARQRASTATRHQERITAIVSQEGTP
jgi:hypothetical protein